MPLEGRALLSGEAIMGRPVLVGYDESPASTLALCWAVEEARLRKSSVLVCHAWHWPYPLRPVEQEVLAQIERVAAHVVDEGIRRARSLAPTWTSGRDWRGGRPQRCSCRPHARPS